MDNLIIEKKALEELVKIINSEEYGVTQSMRIDVCKTILNYLSGGRLNERSR